MEVLEKTAFRDLNLVFVVCKFHLLLWLVMSTKVVAQNSLSAADRAEILRAHNMFRGMVRPRGTNIQRLQYNEELAMVAQSYAEQCTFAPNPDRATQAGSFITVGENTLVTNSQTVDYTALIRDNWFSQRANYDFDTDTCSSVCNEYRQLVWAETNMVGCGVTRCPLVDGFPLPNSLILVCNYAPEGDIPGERPYIRGTSCSQCPDNANTCINRLCSISPPTTASQSPPTTRAPPTTQPPRTRPPFTIPRVPFTLPTWLVILPTNPSTPDEEEEEENGGGVEVIDGEGDESIETPDVATGSRRRSRGSRRSRTRSRSRGRTSRRNSPGSRTRSRKKSKTKKTKTKSKKKG